MSDTLTVPLSLLYGGTRLEERRHEEHIAAGIDHPAYPVEIPAISAEIRDSLAGDLQPSAIN